MPNLYLYELLFAVSVIGILLAALTARKKAARRERRWMPDIRRIT
jgi:hypothetical protein